MSEGGAGFSLRAIKLVGVAALGLAAPAMAQEDQPADTAGASGIRDIVVTAERRAMNLQDTPLSVVALTEDTLASKGIDDLQDLSKFTPNLNIAPSRGGGEHSPTFQIRGISGGGGGTGGAMGGRGGGLHSGGIYIPRGDGLPPRIEVLRGPQGTLFGRNSTGGAIRIFTQKPEFDLNGYVRLTAGNFDRRDIVGMLNLPLSETLAVRMQAAHLSEDGFVKRGDQMLGGYDDFVGRIVTRWEPSADVGVTLGLLYTHAKSDGTPMVFGEFDMRPGIEGVIQGNYADWLNDAFKKAGQAPLAAYNDPRLVKGAFEAPDICLLDDFDPDWDDACDQFNNNKYYQSDLNITWKLSDNHTLTMINGLAKLDHKGVSDWQFLGTEFRSDVMESKVFYHETQLNSALFGGALDLVTGFNYFYERAEQPYHIVTRIGTSVFPSAAQQAAPGFNLASFARGDDDGGLSRRDDNITSQTSHSLGVFASGTWHITDRLNFTGGLRYAYDLKKYHQIEMASGTFTPVAGTTSTTVSSEADFEQIDWRATLDFHFNDDIMAYVTASKAYKAGQFSYAVLDRVAGPDQSGDFIKPIPPEKVINYEFGTRMTLFDRRLRFNPTLFYMKYTNRQASRQVNCSAEGVQTCPFGFRIQVVNSGDVDLYGGELEVQLALTDFLTLDASGSIIDYDLKDPVANSGPNLYPDAPSPMFNVGATLVLPTPIGQTTFNLNYAHVGEQATHPTETGDSAYTLPAYGILNGRIQIRPENAPLTISVFANNILDKTYAVYGQRFGGGYWDAGPPSPLSSPTRSALGLVRGRPREVGVTIQYDF